MLKFEVGVGVGVGVGSSNRGVRSEVQHMYSREIPTDAGYRAIDKVKARLCVDGRAQNRADYPITEIEAPTANIASIFTVAQIVEVGSPYVTHHDVTGTTVNIDAMLAVGASISVMRQSALFWALPSTHSLAFTLSIARYPASVGISLLYICWTSDLTPLLLLPVLLC